MISWTVLIAKLSDEELNTPFDFSRMKKERGSLKRDKNLRDILSIYMNGTSFFWIG